MKAIHKKSGSEHKVEECIGDKVKLVSLNTGEQRVVEYDLFKAGYKLVDENVKSPTKTPTLKAGKVEAQQRATEIVHEAKTHKSIPTKPIEGVKEMEPRKETHKKAAGKGTAKIEPKKAATKVEPKVEPKAKAAKTTKATGTVTHLKDICDALKVDPAKARRVLRAKAVAKPYEWSDPTEIENIKKLLK